MYFKTINNILIIFVIYQFLLLGSAMADILYHEIHGYGTQTEAGLTGGVIKVANLNNDGAGSFREACQTDAPRLIVFEVGGVINLEMRSINIDDPYITVAGQTAPNPGITLIKGSLNVRTHDVVIQHIAIRPGEAGQPKMSGWEPDGMGTDGSEAYNIVFDHCSATWSVDENLSVSGPGDSDPMTSSHDVTLYKCLIAECLFNSTHAKGAHSMGTLLHDGVVNVSIIGCLYAHNNQRNPLFKGNSRAVVVNSVIYNSGERCIHMADYGTNSSIITGISKGALVGNVWIKGTDSSTRPFVTSSKSRESGWVYLEGNILKERSGADAAAIDNYLTQLDSVPLWPDGLIPQPANVALHDVLTTVGARPGERDPIDARIVLSVIDGTGAIIDSEEEVGGYPQYAQSSRDLYVPGGRDTRKIWLDSLSAGLDTDEFLDTSPLIPVITTIDTQTPAIRNEYTLNLTNYPNPFNPTTTIRYDIPKASQVTLTIYNMNGQVVERLVSQKQEPGFYSVSWGARNVSTGVYFYRIQADGFQQVKKMLLIK